MEVNDQYFHSKLLHIYSEMFFPLQNTQVCSNEKRCGMFCLNTCHLLRLNLHTFSKRVRCMLSVHDQEVFNLARVKPTVSFVMSLRLVVLTHGTTEALTGRVLVKFDI